MFQTRLSGADKGYYQSKFNQLTELENGRLSDWNRIVANSSGSDRIGIGRNERRRSPM